MDNSTFQEHILDLAEQGFLVLVESDKLVHQLQLRRRLQRVGVKGVGWAGETPRIHTLNHWMERCWEESWPEFWAAPALRRWRTLALCLSECPPPEPLVPDVPLITDIDASFEQCLRYGVDPGGGEPANQLVEWRRELWRLFDREMQECGLFHPAALPERLFHLWRKKTGLMPSKVAIVGFEFAGYWEKLLFKLLAGSSDVRVMALPTGEVKPQAIVYTDLEQELYGLLEDLTSAAARFPLHELGVVILDPDRYGSLVAKGFQEVFGPPLVGDQAAYNLFPSRSLLQQPLLQAALLPLDFAAGEQSRALLLSLLRSPYYGFLAERSRALCQWDWNWRSEGVERGLREMLGSLPEDSRAVLPERGEELVNGLAPFLIRGTQPGRRLIECLHAFWERMGFPVTANERDEMSRQRLQEILEEIAGELGDVPMTAGELAVWIRAAAGKVYLQKTGYEDAGIQVIGALEARGLVFSRLYAPGLIAGALPQPARPLPFLAPFERRQVQGGTAESQFDFARSLFGQLRSVTLELILSRPMMLQGDEPCLPSPFWPKEGEIKAPPVVPWRDSLPALQRAQWVQEGNIGIASKAESVVAPGLFFNAVVGFEPRQEVSVSALTAILHCSNQYLFRYELGMEPLPEIERGLPPLERGRRIHDVLMACGRRVPSTIERSETTVDALFEELREVALKELEEDLEDFHWSVEINRLLGGEGDIPGLLQEWLRREWERLQDGWKWVAFEKAFKGLKLGKAAISVKGRLDRLDYHAEYGYVCWDYKTGSPPAPKEVLVDLTHPQLPAYLLAVRKGLIREAESDCTGLGAGYIDLRSVRYLKHSQHIKSSIDLGAFLNQWEEVLAKALKELEGGSLTPRWAREDSCDSNCPYGCLCGKLMREVLKTD